MKSYWKMIEDIFALPFIESFHVVVKRLFIAQELITLKMVVNLGICEFAELGGGRCSRSGLGEAVRAFETEGRFRAFLL